MKILKPFFCGIAVGAIAATALAPEKTPDVRLDQVEDHFFVVSSAPGRFAVTHYPACWCRDEIKDLAADKAAQRAYAERELGIVRATK